MSNPITYVTRYSNDPYLENHDPGDEDASVRDVPAHVRAFRDKMRGNVCRSCGYYLQGRDHGRICLGMR